jgi:hypothetical protein
VPVLGATLVCFARETPKEPILKKHVQSTRNGRLLSLPEGGAAHIRVLTDQREPATPAQYFAKFGTFGHHTGGFSNTSPRFVVFVTRQIPQVIPWV